MVVGATSKWQADGSSTVKERNGKVSDENVPLEARWGAGGAMSFRFAEGGCTMALFSRKLENVQPLAEAIKKKTGAKVICVICELASDDSVKKAFDEVRSQVGDPTILIYNAGYTSHGASEVLIEDLPIRVYDEAHDTHLRGAVLCCQQVLPAMRKNKKGTILFSTVPASLRAGPKALPNAITRAGERALCMAISEEYDREGIHAVHCVLNGLIDSPGTRRAKDGVAGDMFRSAIDPRGIAERYWQLHSEDPSCWTKGDVIVQHARAPISSASRM